MTPDVNVLLAASRSDHPHYAVARTWLEQAIVNASQGTPLTLQPMVIASFLRLVTHPKIFVHPTPMSEALRFVDALLASPGVERAELGAEWPTLRELCAAKALAANDVPDAWLAAADHPSGRTCGQFRRRLQTPAVKSPVHLALRVTAEATSQAVNPSSLPHQAAYASSAGMDREQRRHTQC